MQSTFEETRQALLAAMDEAKTIIVDARSGPITEGQLLSLQERCQEVGALMITIDTNYELPPVLAALVNFARGKSGTRPKGGIGSKGLIWHLSEILAEASGRLISDGVPVPEDRRLIEVVAVAAVLHSTLRWLAVIEVPELVVILMPAQL